MLVSSLERSQRRSEEKGTPGQGVRGSFIEEWEGGRREEKREEPNHVLRMGRSRKAE